MCPQGIPALTHRLPVGLSAIQMSYSFIYIDEGSYVDLLCESIEM